MWAGLFCSGGFCGPLIPGTQTMGYADNSHLTRAGSLYMWPFLCTFLRDTHLLGSNVTASTRTWAWTQDMETGYSIGNVR